MNKIILASTAIALSVLFQSCLKDKLTHSYTIFTPVYESKTKVYADIKSNAPQSIQNPGKFFLYENYIFLNEVDKGVHIIDNTDPAHPVIKAFINIPGNLDIAVKGNTLYADLYTDLVVVDITNPLDARFVKYIPSIFPYRVYPNGFAPDNTQVIVDWTRRDTTVAIPSERGPILYASGLIVPSALASMQDAVASGISGSTARFTIVNNDLYTVNEFSLNGFDVSSANDPQLLSTVNLGWDIETIYPFQDKLFIGSGSGMFIYDVSNPASPSLLGQFSHYRSCDPVITDGMNAYVTLHDGTPCEGFENELDVLNVSNLSAPSLIKSYSMNSPRGLTKDGLYLFICDGPGGLRMYDAYDPSNLVLSKQITGLEPNDAIARNMNLIVVAKDGLYQYDYSHPGELIQRSKISVTPKSF